MNLEVIEQGHIWTEMVQVMNRKPGFRRLYIQTEQKRPSGFANAWDRDLMVVLGTRDEHEGTTLLLRDGEDGSVMSIVKLRLPRCLPWMEWTAVSEPDKWGLTILLFTERKAQYVDLPYRVRRRMREMATTH